jgi:predicted nucleotide-binding protein
MRKSKNYYEIKFLPEIIRNASQALLGLTTSDENTKPSLTLDISTSDDVSWSHDSEEEYFSDYSQEHNDSIYWIRYSGFYLRVWFSKVIFERFTQVEVDANSRHQIESIFNIFESNMDRCKLPPRSKEEIQTKLTIFIGHGGSSQWKELKDHLSDKHGYEIEAYEVGSRAGHSIRDILEDMLTKSSFAILVMTGEDRDEQGNFRARQNVIHELGLFQGRLGFSRAIVLLEEGTEEFSNIQGIHQIRYGRGNIKETFGDVLATLRREFRKDN